MAKKASLRRRIVNRWKDFQLWGVLVILTIFAAIYGWGSVRQTLSSSFGGFDEGWAVGERLRREDLARKEALERWLSQQED